MLNAVRYSRYGPLNRYDLIKVLAITTMVIDHIGHFFFPEMTTLRAVGRMAFPCFLFLVGWSGRWKVTSELLIMACFFEWARYMLGYGLAPLNILWSIIIVRWCMAVLERWQWLDDHAWGVFLLGVIWWYPANIVLEYGSLGLLFALAGYYVRKYKNNARTRELMVSVYGFYLLITLMFYRY
ncbi:MAG: hypothetical protein KDD76_04075, partial [Rickettsiales bacterium]|nr:hypothetical protein [Rickettsiales bacterium]